jgi:hypothetical protein
MTPGDRVVVISGRRRLQDGEFAGFDGHGKPRIWFPALGVTETFEWDQLGELNQRVRRNARPR